MPWPWSIRREYEGEQKKNGTNEKRRRPADKIEMESVWAPEWIEEHSNIQRPFMWRGFLHFSCRTIRYLNDEGGGGKKEKSFQNYIAGSDSGSNKEVIDQMILIDSSSGKTSRPCSPSVPCPPSFCPSPPYLHPRNSIVYYFTQFRVGQQIAPLAQGEELLLNFSWPLAAGFFCILFILFLFFACACVWLKSKRAVREESPPPPSPSLCRRRGRGGGGTSGNVLLPPFFCINQIMTLKSLQAAAVTTSKLRSPGLFTGSKPGNNGHRFSPEDAERKKKKRKKRDGGCFCWLSHYMAPLCEVASSHFYCPLPWKVFHPHRFPFCLVCTQCSASWAAVELR